MSKDLIQYMRELPTASIEKRSCGSTLFEKELVDKIEEIVANHSKKSNPKQLTVQVKPQFLYRVSINNASSNPTLSFIFTARNPERHFDAGPKYDRTTSGPGG